MMCEKCEVEMALRRATDQNPYAYKLSSLRGIELVGISVHRCNTCGAESPIIPRIAELHRVIAEHLVQRSASLRADEFRFLRKQAGFPAIKLAALAKVTPETISRIENGQQAASPHLEQLVRAIAAAVIAGGDRAREVLLSSAESTAKNRRRTATFVMDKTSGWRAAA